MLFIITATQYYGNTKVDKLYTMETKFIEGTNEQYSIREDGVIISNYINHYRYWTNSFIRKYRTKELKSNKDGKVNYQIGGRKGQSKTLVISKLMKEYYKGVKCHRCDNMITKKYSQVCNNCATKIIEDAVKKWRLNNPDKCEKYKRERVDELSKSYIAGLLHLKSHELTDELYLNFKATLLVKRKLSEKLNTKPAYL